MIWICLQKQEPLGLYIIQKGVVKITFDMDLVKFENASSLLCENQKQDDIQNKKSITVEKSEGSYFGEWTLLGEQVASLSVIAVGDVVCAILTKEKFDSVVGPLAKLSQDDLRYDKSLVKQKLPKQKKKDVSFLCLTFWV